MLKKIAIILLNYKDYVSKYLPDCWASLQAQDYLGEKKFFIVDNASSEESLTLLNKLAMGAEIIANKENDGFAKGNNDAIKLALKQGFDYVILLNMDTVAERNCLSKMVEAADNSPRPPRKQGIAGAAQPPFIKGEEYIGAVQARLMMHDDKDKTNSLGNVTHFLGFGYSEGYGEKYNPPKPTYQGGSKEICYPSGAAVLFTRQALEKVGLFDEEFWMYNEDQDLGWRLWLNGFKCILAPEAIVYHKYEFSRSIQKYYYLDRNRIIAMLKNYHWATILLILPAFIIMEIGLLLFSLKNGWFMEKIKVYNYFLNLKNWQNLMQARQQTQSLRKVKDQEIIKLFSGKIWYQEIGDARLKVANVVFNTYWSIVKAFIGW